jgi:hypothetical protein
VTQDQQLDKTTIACIRHVTPSGFPLAACDDIANGLRAPDRRPEPLVTYYVTSRLRPFAGNLYFQS